MLAEPTAGRPTPRYAGDGAMAWSMSANSSWLGAGIGSASGTDSRMSRKRSMEVPLAARGGSA